MIEFIKYFETLSVTTRILSVAVLFFLVFIFRNILRKYLPGLVLVFLGKKKLEEVLSQKNYEPRYALRTKVMYQFPPNCQIDPKTFFKYLSEKVQKHREMGEAIVFDLTLCEYCNKNFNNGLKELLNDMIVKNSVQCNVIFPKSDAFKDTDEWLDQELARTGSKSIKKWTDTHQENRQ